MREGPWPNKSSRKESNLHGGISRPARKQGADNSAPLDRPSGIFVPTFTTHPRVCDAGAPPDPGRSGRREIKRIRKFKSSTRCGTSPGRWGRNRGKLRRKGGLATSRPGRYDLTVYTPISPPRRRRNGNTRNSARELPFRGRSSRSPLIRPKNAGRLCVRLRIA